MILQSIGKEIAAIFRKLYMPNVPVLSRSQYGKDDGFSLGWRFLVILFFVTPSLPATEPLQDRALVFIFLQAPVLAVFWVPFIIYVCRRLHGIGVGIPYMGWFLLAGITALFLFSGEYRHFLFRGHGLLVLVLSPLLLWFCKDNPVYGVGVFSRTGPRVTEAESVQG